MATETKTPHTVFLLLTLQEESGKAFALGWQTAASVHLTGRTNSSDQTQSPQRDSDWHPSKFGCALMGCVWKSRITLGFCGLCLWSCGSSLCLNSYHSCVPLGYKYSLGKLKWKFTTQRNYPGLASVPVLVDETCVVASRERGCTQHQAALRLFPGESVFSVPRKCTYLFTYQLSGKLWLPELTALSKIILMYQLWGLYIFLHLLWMF